MKKSNLPKKRGSKILSKASKIVSKERQNKKANSNPNFLEALKAEFVLKFESLIKEYLIKALTQSCTNIVDQEVSKLNLLFNPNNPKDYFVAKFIDFATGQLKDLIAEARSKLLNKLIYEIDTVISGYDISKLDPNDIMSIFDIEENCSEALNAKLIYFFYDGNSQPEIKPLLSAINLSFLELFLGVFYQGRNTEMENVNKIRKASGRKPLDNFGVELMEESLDDVPDEFGENVAITERLLYLKFLGIIDELCAKAPFNTSTNSLAAVLGLIMGKKAGSIQPSLQRMLEKSIDKNNPLNSMSTVKRVKEKLMSIGFSLK